MSGITKITDGILNVAGTNNISDLELKNALVTIIKEPGFSQLQIDKLDGSGIFSISSNLAQNEADHLDIGGDNGNFGLTFTWLATPLMLVLSDIICSMTAMTGYCIGRRNIQTVR